MRKQPTNRRARQAQARKKAAATHSAPTLGKVAKRSSESKAAGNELRKQSAGVAHKLSRVGAFTRNSPVPESPSNSKHPDDSTAVAEPRFTDRPVARSIKPEPDKVEEGRSGISPAVLGLAALLVGGAIWLGFDRSQPASDAGELAQRQAEPVSAAAPQQLANPETSAVPAAPDEPEPIDLDAEPTVPPAALPETVRISAAKPIAAALAKPEQVAEPVPAGPFSTDAAEAQFSVAVKQASACRQDGDPTGVARVVVTFAPSGRVTSATISGPPFAGTSTGSCIAKTMRGMSLPAFEGEHVTISKTVVIM